MLSARGMASARGREKILDELIEIVRAREGEREQRVTLVPVVAYEC